MVSIVYPAHISTVPVLAPVTRYPPILKKSVPREIMSKRGCWCARASLPHMHPSLLLLVVTVFLGPILRGNGSLTMLPVADAVRPFGDSQVEGTVVCCCLSLSTLADLNARFL